jgi:ATP-binding cassette subfamily A (ABC1) protein 3
LVKLNLEEKSTKLKEGMKMMGVSDAALWISWFLTYAMIFLVADLLLAAALKGNIVIYTSFGMFSNQMIQFLIRY